MSNTGDKMTGYRYGDHEPTRNCPYCKTICRADFVDNGIGMQQCGPYHCEKCKASEIGAYDVKRELTKNEIVTGWYKPYSPAGSSVNTIDGRIVSHVQKRNHYRQQALGVF